MKRQTMILLVVALLMGLNAYGLIKHENVGLPGQIDFLFKTGLSTYAGSCEYEGFTCVKDGELDFDQPIDPLFTAQFPAQALAAVLTSLNTEPVDWRLPSIMIHKEAAGIAHDIMIPTQTAVYSPVHNGYIVYCFISTMVPQDHVRRLTGLFHNDGCDYVLENLTNIPADPAALNAEVTRLTNEYMASRHIVEPAVPTVFSSGFESMKAKLFTTIQQTAPLGLIAFGDAMREVDAQAVAILTDPIERGYFQAAVYTGFKSGENWTPAANGGNSGWNHYPGGVSEPEAAQAIDVGNIVKEDVDGFFSGGGLKGAIVASVCELVRQLADEFFPGPMLPDKI